MPRRNKHLPPPPPIGDVTPARVETITRTPPPGRWRAAAARERQARMQGAIDWSVCLVPGCGRDLIAWGHLQYPERHQRNPNYSLPLCSDHQMIVWQQVQRGQDLPEVIESNTRVLEQQRLEREQAQAQLRAKRLADNQGHIYFVRINDLVKVGWSRDVHTRLRSYGPLADVLCIYPASRADETTLHRQLRPALARGREWYHDGSTVRLFVSEAVKQHGPPVTYDEWSKPAELVGTRSRRPARRA